MLLLIVGAILGSGIILSFYGAQLTTQNIIVKEERLSPDSIAEVSLELDPNKGQTGVYAVLLENYVENSITISIYDPFGSKIISKVAEKESTEERFEIISDGRYKLEVKNSGTDEFQIIAGLGYMPDTGTLSIGISGFYLLIIGLIGIVGIGIYVIKNRRKHNLS